MSDNKTVRYFIVGAPKCASTSLYDLFEADPAYAVTAIKETHHFSAQDVENGYYDDVPIVRTADDYDQQFQGDGIRIDICPSYFASESTIERIRQYNPDARILILVREPVKRMISHFKMDVALGYTEAGSLESIWQSKSGKRFEEYFGIGRYVDWINRWKAAFGEDSVFVVNLVDHPFSDSRSVLEAFLERPLPADELPVSNVAKSYNVPIPILRKLGFFKIWDNLVPRFIKNIIKSMLPRKEPVKVELSASLKSALADYYADDFRLLETLRAGRGSGSGG